MFHSRFNTGLVSLPSLAAWALAGAAVIGCGSSTSSSAPVVARDGSLLVFASVAQSSAADVATVVVTVTGPNISSAITANLVDSNGTRGGIVGNIPAGADTVHGEAYDTDNQLIVEGDAAVTISANTESPVALVLQNLTAAPAFSNSAPIIDSVIASTADVAPGGTVHLTVNAHDPDQGDTLTYAWTATDNTTFTDATTASTDWTAPGDTGNQTVTITVTDSEGASSSVSLTLDVETAYGAGSANITASFNTAPNVTAVTATPSQLTAGETTMLGVQAQDDDNNTLTYSWTTTCDGSLKNSTTATPSLALSGSAATGSCDVVVTADDGNGGTNTGTLTINVGAAPPVYDAPVIDTSVQSTDAVGPGDSVSIQISAHDPANGTLSYAWTSDGDASDFDAKVGTTGTGVTWTATDCAPTTTITVTVTSSADGASTSQNFTVDCSQ